MGHDKELFDIDYERVAIQWQPSVAQLYEDALKYETGSAISSAGALITASGSKRGRSPKDKRIVDEPSSSKDVWVMCLTKPFLLPLLFTRFLVKLVSHLNLCHSAFICSCNFIGGARKSKTPRTRLSH